LKRLKTAESGVYCGPLRLLAWEVADGLNNKAGGLVRTITQPKLNLFLLLLLLLLLLRVSI